MSELQINPSTSDDAQHEDANQKLRSIVRHMARRAAITDYQRHGKEVT